MTIVKYSPLLEQNSSSHFQREKMCKPPTTFASCVMYSNTCVDHVYEISAQFLALGLEMSSHHKLDARRRAKLQRRIVRRPVLPQQTTRQNRSMKNKLPLRWFCPRGISSLGVPARERIVFFRTRRDDRFCRTRRENSEAMSEKNPPRGQTRRNLEPQSQAVVKVIRIQKLS